MDASAAPRRGRLGRRLALLAGTLLALGVLSEGALRVWRPFPHEPPLYPGDVEPISALTNSGVLDPDVGWKLGQDATEVAPKGEFSVTYHVDAEGFRAGVERAPREDELRIVFVGDSFTFGSGVEVEETFVERIAAERPEVRVFNYGMAGFGVDQMWQTLLHYGLRRKPHVVLAVFVTDDLTRSLTAYRSRGGWVAKPTFFVDGGELVRRTRENAPNALVRWTEQSLYLTEVWRRAENKFGLEHGFGERFEVNRALFAAMGDACRDAGSTLVVVHLPQRASWRPLPALASALAELDIAFLDLGGVAVDEPKRLYYPLNQHLTAEGHAVVAREMSRFLLAHGLFDRPNR